MTGDGLDEARKDLAEVRRRLEDTMAMLELAPMKPGIRESEAKAKALASIKETLQSVDALAQNIGGIPAPMRH
ncbi:hypothetical protein C1893_23335 [Pseudomonas sp. MPR-ANC1]|uniref:hypothetical protein n=1 Tax=Pseudomonas sp. MPR-ANC1 TaxID=2075548 RepID=UPI000CD270C0|nr:hypothetical protein [Pseudomonas sp. MPR-ANC1]POA45591.1 hypothetical protein C1893_23335 [Pseudomonas sp. MPR-ANC1]